MKYRFDDFELDSQTFELSRRGQVVRLQRQPAVVLVLLIERAGQLVTRTELREHVWGDDRFVDVDRSLAYCLRQIRIALGDDHHAPTYIQTLRGLGFRFVGEVTVAESAPSPVPRIKDASDALAWVRWPRALAWVAAASVVLGAGYAAAVRWPAVGGRAALDAGQHALLRRADEYMKRRDVSDVKTALALYRRVLAAAPDHPRSWAGVATAESTLAFHHSDLREAQAALLKSMEALRLAPGDPVVLAAHARSLHVAGQLEEAANVYGRAIRSAPDRPDLVDDLALLEHQRGRLDTAVHLLKERWVSTVPDPEPAGLLAAMLTNLGFASEARAWTRLADDLVPDGTSARYWTGLVAYRAGRLEEAEATLVPLLADPDPGAQVVSLASIVLAKRRGADAALPTLAAAAEALPGSSTVRSLLADVYRAVGREDDARRERARVVEICERGAADAPQTPIWPRCLASQLAVRGDVAGAVAAYERAVSLGWRKLGNDSSDGWLDLISDEPRFQAAQKRMADDIDRMRRNVERDGIPAAAIVR